MDIQQKIKEWQCALDFVMLKTQLQRFGVIGGGYGCLALMYGVPSGHRSMYLVHCILGIASAIQGIILFIRPKPRFFISMGVLLLLMGFWINMMAALNEGAGGSPKLFAIWGLLLVLCGIRSLIVYRRFSYFNTYTQSKAAVKDACEMVKKLISANPKKQKDVVIMDTRLATDLMYVGKNACRWKVRLLPDMAVLYQGNSLRIFALGKSAFEVSAIQECKIKPYGHIAVCIEDNRYVVNASDVLLQRLEQWVSSED